ncbi:conserved exported hypothetical protein [Candidatus Nitrotoga sp. BS]|nr:conserved exported hypothetical protein [Candidatus Nitrotoga sp. BS]
MNSKVMITKAAPIVLAVLMAYSLSAQAGTVTLTGVTTNTCASYTGFSSDANGNLTVVCSGEAEQAPSVAPSCTLTASPSTISEGASSTLIANCTPAATSYVWAGVNFTGAGGNVTPTSTTTYSVTGSNSVGSGNTALREVTVTAGSPPPVQGGSSGKTTPTSQSSLTEIRAWNYAFSILNNIPPNAKVEQVGYMAYLKLIQSGKPTQIFLPTAW